jgi:large subunit ribosomal protein L13
MKIVIDATNAVLGRLAAYTAKQALLGNDVVVVNVEKAIVIGSRENILEYYQHKKSRGNTSQRGPFISSDPEKLFKRTVRGMLPDYREGRGKVALKKIKGYKGLSEEHKEHKMLKFGKETNKEHVTVDEISRMM